MRILGRRDVGMLRASRHFHFTYLGPRSEDRGVHVKLIGIVEIEAFGDLHALVRLADVFEEDHQSGAVLRGSILPASEA